MDDRGFLLDSDATSQDIYTVLSPSEIRLLLLSPGPSSSPLTTELTTISVSPNTSTTQYEALSYVWGDTVQSRTINCNGFDFAVTESLYSALLNLRYPSTWRRVWVDQLCINQDDSDEVLAQVGRMGEVYSSAVRVVVWLGGLSGDSKMEAAWKVLRETMVGSSLVRSDFLLEDSTVQSSSPSSSPLRHQRPGATRRVSSGSVRSMRSTWSNKSGRSSKSSKSTRLSSSSKESLVSNSSIGSGISKNSYGSVASSSPSPIPTLKQCLAIFQHVWFTRKWTFQEVVLAKAAIICCGQVEMAWSDLTAWYFHYASKFRSTSILYDSNGSFENIMNVRNEMEKGDLKLSYLLMLTRQRQSMKPEDAIYALLGLLPDLAQYLDMNKAMKLGDYFHLYLAAFKYCLEQESDLSILSAAGLYKGETAVSWPTWLPDWREQIPLRPLVLTSGQTGTSEYRASADSKPRWTMSFPLSKPTLTVRGIRIGCIHTRKGSWPNAYFIAGALASKSFAYAGVTPSSFSQSIRTLMTSFSPGNSPASTPCKTSETARDSYSQSVIHAAKGSQDRCEPIRTSALVEAGDWVCIILGGPVLYIVRPVTGPAHCSVSRRRRTSSLPSSIKSNIRCQFVGECAIPGLMRGAILEYIEDPDEEYLDFDLI